MPSPGAMVAQSRFSTPTPLSVLDGAHPVRVGRSDEDVREVERTRAEIRAVRHRSPGRPAVVGPPELAMLRLDLRVDAPAAPCRDADLPDHAGREAAAQLPPRQAVVVRAVDAVLGTAARERPRPPAKAPHPGEQRRGPVGTAREIRRTGREPEPERVLPTQAAVGGHEDAARRAVAEEVSEHAYRHAARVARIDRDRRDRSGVVEAGVGPMLPAVARMPDAVAFFRLVARVRLAGPA